MWVDGRFVAEHDGGYTPFYVDLTPYLRPGRPATLTVRVWDACDADTLLGKQVDEWYTHSGGIWQPVWLEGRPAAYIAQAHVTPHLETGQASFAVAVDATGESAAGSLPGGGDFGGRGLPPGRDTGGGHAGADDRESGGAGAAAAGLVARGPAPLRLRGHPHPPAPCARRGCGRSPHTQEPPSRGRGRRPA